jgi:hypothetical protein
MAKYRRLPINVEAEQFFLDKPLPEGVMEFTPHWSSREKDPPRRFSFVGESGSCGISPGDWIVTNQWGARYVVKQASFAATYEPV